MTLTINDKKEKTTMVITNNGKTLLKRRGKSIVSLLKFVMENTTKQNIKDSIMSLQKTLPLMRGSITTITIREAQ